MLVRAALWRLAVTLATLAALCLTSIPDAHARQGEAPFTRPGTGLPGVSALRVTAPDVNMLRAENDAARTSGEKTLRYAEPIAVSSTPDNDGVWQTLPDGTRMWRLAVVGPGATDINLGLETFELPPGARLWVVSADHDYYEGPYTWQDNAEHGQLWVPVVPGDEVTLELQVPPQTKFEPRVELTHVGYGYLDLFGLSDDPNLRQGSCNIDVICPEGDPWRDQIQSVATYSYGGSTLCTGSMVMDAEGSFRPFFLTAYHCGVDAGSAPSMVVYWNFESPTCGQLSGGSLADNQTGAIFRANRQDVDMALVELDELPDPAFDVFYSGWDRSGTPALGSVAIHHPNTDEKAISFNDDVLTIQTSCIGGFAPDTHWRVDNWELGTTEPGSSGSGLWNPDNGLLIGFLSGGLAACGNTEYDCYGRFDVAWDGASPSSRLRDWLDPNGVSGNFVQGSFPAARLAFDSVTATDLCNGQSDGVIAPGERVEIDLAMAARSGDISGISASLVSNTPGVNVIVGGASYPDAPENTVVVNDTPFVVSVDASVACFSVIELVASFSVAGGDAFDVTIVLPVGQLQGPTGLPLPIPDGSPTGATSQFAIAEDVTITDLTVNVQITHTYVGDLNISLRSPAGTTVTLLDRPGVPASTYGCSNDDLDVTFDDASSQQLESYCAGQTPWYSGVAQPTQPLSAFDGESTQGTWSLIVSDNAGADTGAILDWSLTTIPGVSQGVCEPCSGAPIAVVTTDAALPVSLYVVPDGSGDRLDNAQKYDPQSGATSRVDATIFVDVYEGPAGPPAIGIPAEDVTLSSSDANLAPCTPIIADGPSDANGRMTFSGALAAGGTWAPGEILLVTGQGFDGVTGLPEDPSDILDIRFNSADLDGNGAVELGDVGDFAARYFGPYDYAVDYAWDGVLNLTDIGLFAQSLSVVCPAAPARRVLPVAAGQIDIVANDGTAKAVPGAERTETLRVVLSGDTARQGIGAWDAAVVTSDNVTVVESQAIGGLDFADGHDFIVGGALGADDGELVLATLRVRVEGDAPAWVRLEGAMTADDPAVLVRDGGVQTIASSTFRFGDDRPATAPREVALSNHPNPFNPATEIMLALPQGGDVDLVILDTAGRRVTRLTLGQQPAGEVRTTWRGTDLEGRPVVSGVYFVRAFVDGAPVGEARKMALLK